MYPEHQLVTKNFKTQVNLCSVPSLLPGQEQKPLPVVHMLTLTSSEQGTEG